MAINGGMECNVHEKRFSDDTEVPSGVWSRENSIKLSDCVIIKKRNGAM